MPKLSCEEASLDGERDSPNLTVTMACNVAVFIIFRDRGGFRFTDNMCVFVFIGAIAWDNSVIVFGEENRMKRELADGRLDTADLSDILTTNKMKCSGAEFKLRERHRQGHEGPIIEQHYPILRAVLILHQDAVDMVSNSNPKLPDLSVGQQAMSE